ncbi:MAG: type II toxin-antitoxin system RelE/ParE family toxin [archaeon]
MPFDLVWTDQARKNLGKLEQGTAKRIFGKVNWANENNLLFLEKVASLPLMKYRVGAYRVFFEKGPENSLFAMTVRHRSKAYERVRGK